jgi:hypothetical protein
VNKDWLKAVKCEEKKNKDGGLLRSILATSPRVTMHAGSCRRARATYLLPLKGNCCENSPRLEKKRCSFTSLLRSSNHDETFQDASYSVPVLIHAHMTFLSMFGRVEREDQ